MQRDLCLRLVDETAVKVEEHRIGGVMKVAEVMTSTVVSPAPSMHCKDAASGS